MSERGEQRYPKLEQALAEGRIDGSREPDPAARELRDEPERRVTGAFLPDDIGENRLLWMKGHRAMARMILNDPRLKRSEALPVIQEYFDYAEDWICDWERTRNEQTEEPASDA